MLGVSAGLEGHLGGQRCAAVSKIGPHTVSAGQYRWKMRHDSLLVKHTRARVCLLHARVFSGEYEYTVFFIDILYVSVQS